MKLRLDPSTPDGSVADRARSAILEAILDHRFGARLPPEEELAEMLGVSRTSVRDALESLETRGLIRRRRSIGTTINANFTPAALAFDRLRLAAAGERAPGSREGVLDLRADAAELP